ncbi:MAG: RNA polymerase sigma factor [Planctomycetota bacterium]
MTHDPVKETESAEYGAASMGGDATRLMLLVKNGDHDAFEALVAGLRGSAFHVARSLVGSRDDALELSQEAFLKVYRARETFREGEPFLPWFHRILRNTCFSFLRDKGRAREISVSGHRPGVDDDEHDFEIEDDVAAPGAGLDADERGQVFWKAFQALAAKDREMLALRHFQELSYREIAEHLGIPEGTVMSRLFHARRRLRDALPAAWMDELAEPAAARSAGEPARRNG